jgi:uncharacterized phiE125 gp8 family phage protein
MAVNTYSLVTLAQVKCYLGIVDEDSDQILTALIDRASGYIERYCNRKLKTRTYSREVYYGNGYRRLILDQYPVTAVTRVSYGRKNAFSITNTTATNNATVEITASAVKLTADGAAATSLALATYATITLLLAAINAVSGWTATLPDSSLGVRKSTDLLMRPGMHCLSPTVCYAELPLGELTDYFLVDPTEDRNYGVIESVGGFVCGEDYFVDYTAGFTTIPFALEEACILLIAYRYNQKAKDASIKSESLGDYSYSLRDMSGALPPDLQDAIDLYRRRVF